MEKCDINDTCIHNLVFVPLRQDSVYNFAKKIRGVEKDPVFIFDIDETLYPEIPEVKDTRHTKMLSFLESLGHSPKEAKEMCERFSKRHGIPIKGFTEDLQVSESEFRELCDPVSSSLNKLEADLELRSLLLKLKGRKFCFTNADAKHASKALSILDISDCFDGVFHCEYSSTKFLCKPDPRTYKIIEDVLGIKSRDNVHFFDDSFVNIDTAKKLGWNGYLVTNQVNIKYLLNKIRF